tara:strand:- start:416 stop:670 length:255 start_codon:yes stop_codon:yes gene_type:complete
MIIECTNCNKKFRVDDDLIPENGREIICGSCNYAWHFKPEKTNEKSLVLDNETIDLQKKQIKMIRISMIIILILSPKKSLKMIK